MKSSEYERIHVTMCKNTAANQTIKRIKPPEALFYLKYVYLGICLPKLMIGPIIVVLINRFNKTASILKPIFRHAGMPPPKMCDTYLLRPIDR